MIFCARRLAVTLPLCSNVNNSILLRTRSLVAAIDGFVDVIFSLFDI